MRSRHDGDFFFLRIGKLVGRFLCACCVVITKHLCGVKRSVIVPQAVILGGNPPRWRSSQPVNGGAQGQCPAVSALVCHYRDDIILLHHLAHTHASTHTLWHSQYHLRLLHPQSSFSSVVGLDIGLSLRPLLKGVALDSDQQGFIFTKTCFRFWLGRLDNTALHLQIIREHHLSAAWLHSLWDTQSDSPSYSWLIRV